MARKLSTLVWALIGITIGAMAGETYIVNTSAPALAPHLNLYVFNYAAQDVAAIDVDKMELIARTPLEARVGHAVLSFEGKQVYAVGADARTLIVLDFPSLQIRSEVPLPGWGEDLALSRDGRTLFVTTRDADAIATISTANAALIGQIIIGEAPHGIAVDEAGQLAYVAETGSNKVSAISLRDGMEVGSYRTGPKPTMVALSSDNRWLAVTNSGGDSVTVIDLAGRRGYEVKTGLTPRGIAFAGGKFYVANWGEPSISVVDPTSHGLERSLKLDRRPQIIVPSPSGQVYVGADGEVVVVSAADYSIVKRVTVEGLQPSEMILAGGSLVGARITASTGKLDSKNFTCGG